MTKVTFLGAAGHFASGRRHSFLPRQVCAADLTMLACVLAAAVLVTANVLAVTRLHGQSEKAVLFAALGAAGMPVLIEPSHDCRSPGANASARRLRGTDLLALLEAK